MTQAFFKRDALGEWERLITGPQDGTISVKAAVSTRTATASPCPMGWTLSAPATSPSMPPSMLESAWA